MNMILLCFKLSSSRYCSVFIFVIHCWTEDLIYVCLNGRGGVFVTALGRHRRRLFLVLEFWQIFLVLAPPLQLLCVLF